MVIVHKALKQALQILFIAISSSAVYQSAYAACGPNTWDDPACALPITINNAAGSQNYNINSSYSSPTTPLNVTNSTIGNFSIGQVGTPVTINSSGTAVGVFGSYFGNSILDNLTINSGSTITSPRGGVYLDATTINGTFTNNGSLTSTGSSPALAIRSLKYSGQSYVNNLINNGTISGGSYSLTLESSASVGTLTNNGSITGSNNFYGAVNLGSAASSTSPKVSISSLINNGTISTSSATGFGVRIGVNDAATIGTLYNYGSISSPLAGIFVNPGASLGTLNNLQGAGNAAGALTYAGSLPTNYNVIVNNLGTYGQLSGVTANGGLVGNVGVSGSTNFGIYPTSTLSAPTVSSPTVYANIFQSIPETSIRNTTGIELINGTTYNWAVIRNTANTNNLDLVLLSNAKAPITINTATDTAPTPTPSNPVTTGTVTVTLLDGKTEVVSTTKSYVVDPVSGTPYVVENISAPLDATTVAAENAYLRSLGLGPLAPDYYDTYNSVVALASTIQNTMTQQWMGVNTALNYDCKIFDVNNFCITAGGRYTTLNANNFNTTAALLVAAYRPHPNWRVGAYVDQSLANNSSNVSYSGSTTPTWGLFGAWVQNPEDQTGIEVKVSAGVASNGVTFTRNAYYNYGFSESGNGSTTISSMAAQLTAKYGFAVTNNTLVTPYVGGRYSNGQMGAYTEGTSSNVNFPISYNQLNNYTSTVLAGVQGAHKLNEMVGIFGSVGAEKDTTYNIGNLTTTGNFNSTVAMNNNYQSTRSTATIGTYYDLSPKERLALTGLYQQSPYKGVSSNTVLATYTVGL